MYEAFRVFDRNGTGCLNRDEFEQIVQCGSFMNEEMKERMRDKAANFFKKKQEMAFPDFVTLVCNK